MSLPTLDCAYFSMEVMLETDIPSYAGGLGVLAGDVLRSAADLSTPVVGVSLVYSGNTFNQTINPDGSQSFVEVDWQRMDQLSRLPTSVTVTLGDHEIAVGCWRYDIVGLTGFVVPVFLLDTNIDDNPQWAKDVTKNLYGGDASVRICQEIVLGIAGVKMLEQLGYAAINNYHLNEGHCAFVSLALLSKHGGDEAAVKSKVTFTTHTPAPEGHDHFTFAHAQYWAQQYLPQSIKQFTGKKDFSLSDLCLNLSRVHIAVSQKHQIVSHHLFPKDDFIPITNGVHHRSWVWYILQDLYDKCLPGWLQDPEILTKSPTLLTDDALSHAHSLCKKELVNYVNHHLREHLGRTPNELFDPDTLIISLARRPVAYKRPLLLYHDLERFTRIGMGKIQIIQCGKSHPQDTNSQSFVREIIKISQRLKTVLRIAYLENYSPKIARLLVAGSDVWLNTPRRPLEASGTSGMKAALNGVLNFSVLDGWWIEGYKANPQAGFTIGPLDDSVAPQTTDAPDSEDANDLYTKLESEIIPLYYNHRSQWLARMKHAITLGGYFNTHRVLAEYKRLAWTNGNS